MQPPGLSVVVLCYRSGEAMTDSVKQILRLLEPAVPDYELILVGNYDRPDDSTPRVVARIAQNNPRILYSAVPKKGMMGWDMRTGLALAKGDYIAVIDGDGQMPFEDIVRVYASIKEAGADMAKTYRTKRGDDLWRIVVSHLFNFLFMILFPGLNTRDINSKPKIFTREALAKLALTSDDWFVDAEIMIQARRNGFTIVEIPTIFNKLAGRNSFVKTHTILEFLRNLFVFRVREFTAKKHE